MAKPSAAPHPDLCDSPEELLRRGFEVQKLLGTGSYGKVFLVKRRSDGKLYAMKEGNISKMSQAERADALNEIRLLASVKHTNVIRYYEAFSAGDNLYIIMEYASEGDLSAVIKSGRQTNVPLPEDALWRYLIMTCKGLQNLHEHKILHRDIKPANLFLAEDDIVKVGDLGIAKLIREGVANTHIGTPHYMPPELWLNKPYSYSSDMWALGCCLYELMMYRVPFEARSVDELRVKVMACKYRPIPMEKYSADLCQVVACLLQLNAARRPSASLLLATKQLQRNMYLIEVPSSPGCVNLLQTIKVPRNMREGLEGMLPPAALLSYKVVLAS
ncbi:hypothetical protein WJX73_004555 [Symbiochloris irregularis]|uniref:non-specific serine/threonine protein kinase n=1 Tax=Symbiochloris irregularis TaxID=706552 RepID=A0AAW1PBD6_9CHLO